MPHRAERSAGRDTLPAAQQPDLLRVEVAEPRPGVIVLSPVGEVDIATAYVLRDAAHDALATGPRCVVVDLGRLTFCGSTGLVALMEAHHDAKAAGARFHAAGGRPIVLRVLELTQLGPALAHRRTVADVLRELDC